MGTQQIGGWLQVRKCCIPPSRQELTSGLICLSHRIGDRGLRDMAQEGLVFAMIGLLGTYFIALVIEKHYTAFSTALGNLACLLCSSLGLITDDPANVRLWLPLSVAIITFSSLVLIAYWGMRKGRLHHYAWKSVVMTGQGLFVTSFALAMIVYFYFGNDVLSLVVFILNLVGMLYLKSRVLRLQRF